MVQSEQNATSVPARFHLEGVAAPLRAKVDHKDSAGLRLRQELPFLQLQKVLRDEGGREASLTSVGVSLRDGVPSLILDFAYADTGREPTTPFAIGEGGILGEGNKKRRDETQPYAFEKKEKRVEVQVDGASLSAPSVPMLRPASKKPSLWLRLWGNLWNLLVR